MHRLRLTVYLTACLTLSACSTAPRSVPVLPPDALLVACAAPKVARPATWADVVAALRTALSNCDADKTALREWADKTKGNYDGTK